MVLLKALLPAFAALALIGKVVSKPQITPTLPFVPDDDGPGDLDDLDDFNDDGRIPAGVIVGTGSAGETTYVISVTDGSDDRPITATLVAGASGATIVATYDYDDDGIDDDDDDDDDLFRSVACGIEDDIAVCTYARVGVISGTLTTTSFATRTAAADRITLIASTGSVTAADPSQTVSGSATDTGTGTGTSTGAGATSTTTPGAATETSGARKSFAGAGALVTAFSLVFVAFAMV